MSYLRVRNWHKFQHYTDRKPIWIKYYVELLDDKQMKRLPVTTRLLWDQLLLLAARHDNAILNDSEEIAKDSGIELEACREGLEVLLKGRWLSETETPRRASKAASSSARAEKEKRKRKTPKSPTENSKAAEDWVQATGWRFHDVDLIEELGSRWGLEPAEKQRLLALAQTIQALNLTDNVVPIERGAA